MAKRGSRVDPITIDDDDEPAVKREAEEEEASPTIAEVKEELETLKRLHQRLILIAGEKEARIEHLQERIECLENVIDQKHDFLKNKSTNDDLEKKVNDLTEELKEERRERSRADEEKKKCEERAACLNRQLEEMRRQNEDLAVQYRITLQDEIRREREEHDREPERINMLLDELEMERRQVELHAIEQKRAQEIHLQDQARINTLTDELEMERRQVELHAIEQRRAQEVHLQDRARIEEMEVEMLKLREDLVKTSKKIGELSSQLTSSASQGVQSPTSPECPEKEPVQPEQHSVSGPQDAQLKKQQESVETGDLDPSEICID